jgi:hypothetical protein
LTRALRQSQEQLAEVRERLAQLEPAVVEQPATEPIPAPEPEPVPLDPRDVYVQPARMVCDYGESRYFDKDGNPVDANSRPLDPSINDICIEANN